MEKPDRILLPPLEKGTLIKRYKRFLADVELESGETVTAHCPNSGSMKGCAVAGRPVWLSTSDNSKRKYPYTWELIELETTFCGINTLLPNHLVKQAVQGDVIPKLSGFDHVRSEVKVGEHSRLDLMLEKENGAKCYVEIKNCTLVENGKAMFPDAVTTRGHKHLDELETLVKKGHGAVIFFLIQRMDALNFSPAAHIDEIYAEKLKKVCENGVKVMAWDTEINPAMVRIATPVPVLL